MRTVKHISLLGVGQRFPQHLTAETLSILECSERVYTLLSTAQIQRLPADIADKCVELTTIYSGHRPRRDNYREVASTILRGSRAHRHVAYLTLGNPRVLDSVSQMLKDASSEDLCVEAYPAVSSFDSVLVDVNYDPASGVQVVEATNLLLYSVPLTPLLACLIFQPSMFATDKPRLTSSSPLPKLDALRDHLVAIWDATHPAAFVVSAYRPDGAPRIHWTTIGRLCAGEFVRGSTLFIPPVKTPAPSASVVGMIESSRFG